MSADLTPFIAKAQFYLAQTQFDLPGDARENFRKALIESGFEPPQAIELGRLHRIKDPTDKGHKKSGWVIYNEFADANHEGKVFAVGTFGTWRGQPEKVTWTSRSTEAMTQADRLHYMAQIDAARLAREAEERIRWGEAAQEAATLWGQISTAPVDHPYLTRKRISPMGDVRLSRDALTIPVIIDGAISSLQFISPNGEKKFLTGGRTKGGYFCIPSNALPDAQTEALHQSLTVYVCEGYATGASIAEATGGMVYCAFSAQNLYEISAHAKRQHGATHRIVIAGDDDVYSDGNAGRTKATQAAEALNLDLAFPIFNKPREGLTDFNDLHIVEGLKAVLNILGKQLPPESLAPAYVKTKSGFENCADIARPPPGVLLDIFDFYNATSGNQQFGFATQTALSIASAVLARSFKTNKDNFSSLYFLNVGKSSTGKEHAKTVTEMVLNAAGMDHLITGDGYTSGGAVFSALLDRPRHISVIDEFGRYLEAGAAGKFGNHNQREANTKLMESIGRAHTVMRPPTYSTMTLKKDAADSLKNRRVFNPAITLLTMTTPATLFKTLDISAIKDGFINRFIISISDAERSLRHHKDQLPVPETIKDWVISIENRAGNIHSAAEPPKFTVLNFTTDALEIQEAFQLFCIEQANDLDRFGMAEITGRSNELAMRVSLICALSRDAEATAITGDDMIWAVGYVKSCMMTTISRVKMTISASDFEGHKKEVLQALRDASPSWVKFSMMNKAQPYTQHQRKYLQEILDALTDAELIDVQQAAISGRGRPTKEYRAMA